jgi:hypothetical protein
MITVGFEREFNFVMSSPLLLLRRSNKALNFLISIGQYYPIAH